jgi:colanic acid/amylovoran biosynthesis glycosyltransferase
MAAASNTKKNICVIHPTKFAYSETFIHNHIHFLPANVHALYGGLMSGEMRVSSDLKSEQLLVPPFYRRAEKLKNLFLRFGKYADDQTQNDLSKKLSPVSTWYLSKYFIKNKIHAVLAEYGPTGTAVMEACRKAGVPLIVHFHGYDAHLNDLTDAYSRLYRKMFFQAGAIVAVSRKMEKQLIKLGAPPEKIHYNVCGIEMTLFKATDPGKNPPHFLAVGRFVDKKAPYLTILAFKELLNHFPSARLVMVGDGPLLETCIHLSKALNLSNSIEFTGPLKHDQVAMLMQKSRAFVQHSVTPGSGDSEGTPVSLLEACASGLPIISTRHAGIKDIIIENKIGFLVDEFDIQQMTKHMIALAQQPELALDLGKNGRSHILNHLTMEKSINTLWKIISDQITG